MDEVRNMYNHFSRIAPGYRELRTTDVEPIALIGETLKGLSEVKAADVGCGAGRYDLLLFRYINNLHLTCIDINETMLKQVSDYLTRHKITNFKTIKSDAEVIPLKDNSMDCILTFNAIHHFDIAKFFDETARVLRSGGFLGIYTRSRAQNKKTIWGQYFPGFVERENRLLSIEEFERIISRRRDLRLEEIKTYNFKRIISIDRLMQLVSSHHYSTFKFYTPEELKKTTAIFRKRLENRFADLENIQHDSGYTLLLVRKK